MLTGSQIQAATALLQDGKLPPLAQQQLLTLIRALPDYRARPALYPQLATRLANATGLTAQILQAALTQVEAVGSGQESLGSEQSAGVSWSRERNRNEFVLDALNALYDVPASRPASAVVVQSSSVSLCAAHGCSYQVCGCGGSAVLLI